MKTRILTLIMSAVFLTSQPAVVLAQGRGWSAVQAVPADDRLIVKQRNGETITGTMIEANETNLTISRHNKVVNISRNNVVQIARSMGKANKTKWALIGAAVGAGTGGAIGAGKASTLIDDGEIYIPVGIMFGAGIGAGVGAVMGANRRKRELIYSAP